VTSDPSITVPAALRALEYTRLRNYALALGATIWTVLIVNTNTPGVVAVNGHLKGEDYAHFYVLGRLAAEHRPDLLYDMAGQAEYLQRVVPGAHPTFFVPVYGPQVALVFRPFAAVAYLPSAVLWAATTLALYGLCCLAVLRRCPALRGRHREIVLLLLAWPGLWQLVVHGQNSALALGAVTAGWLCLRAGRPVAAGLAFGLLFYKPQLGIALSIALVATGRWAVVLGMAASVAAQLGLAAAVFGIGTLAAYGQMLARLPAIAPLLEPKPYLLHSLRAFFAMLPPVAAVAVPLAILLSAAVVAAAVRHWRSMRDPDMSVSLLILATLLVSPHTSVYDLAIAAPALLVIADRMVAAYACTGRPDRVGIALMAAMFLLPLLPFIARFTSVQPTVVCLAWLLFRSAGCAGRASLCVAGAGPAAAPGVELASR
jgi:hypothetical protein